MIELIAVEPRDAYKLLLRFSDGHGLRYLQNIARDRKNVFAALMQAVKARSLGQISHALYDVGEECRRNM